MAEEIYSDPNPTDPLNVPLLTDISAVKGSLINILKIEKGEVPFGRDIGGEWEENLFESHTEETALAIFSGLVDSVELNDPRIKIKQNETLIIPKHDAYTYEAQIVASIQGLDERSFEVVGRFL